MTYELKTKVNSANVTDFLHTVDDTQKQEDCFKLLEIFERLSWEKADMWGENIVGFGTYTYTYASGHTWDWMRTGFSPRKTALTLYIMPGYTDMSDLLWKLGKHKLWKSCLYIKKLSDVDLKVLEQIIEKGLEFMNEKYQR